MLHTFVKAYPVVFLIFTIFYKKIHITKKQFIVFWWIFVFSLSALAYNMTPDIGWDVNSHFLYMDQIRGSGMSFGNFLFNNDTQIGGGSYTSLLTFNALRYIVVHMSNNNFWMPAICIFIDYSILGYIVLDWTINNNGDYRLNLLTMILSFTFMPYVHTASGMRNALCASIMGLAAYLYLYKKKNIVWLLFLTFLAVTTHPAAIITFPFILLARLNWGIVGYIAVFFISLLANPLAQWMLYSQVSFLSLIGRKYISYTSETQYRASRAPLYGVLLITAIFLILYFLLYRRFNMKEDKKNIYNFLAIYMLYIWGNIGNYDMVLRPAYVIATLSPILCTFLTDKKIWSQTGIKEKGEKLVNIAISLAIFSVGIYVNYKLIPYSAYFK